MVGKRSFRSGSTNVSSYIRRLIIIFTLVTTLLVATTISFHEIFVFQKIRSDQREAYLGEQKSFIKDLIINEVAYVENQKLQFDEQIKGKFKLHVQNAYLMADKLYKQYEGKMSRLELQQLIINAVSSQQNPDLYSRVFINSLEGKGVFYHGQSSRHGKNLIDFKDVNGNHVVRNEIKLLKETDEGFIDYGNGDQWDMDSIPHHKITYVKKFEQFNWYFGYKGYLEEYYEDLKKEIAQKVSSVRFRHGGYIFMNEEGGDPVVLDGKIYNGDYNFFDGTDSIKHSVFLLETEAANSSPDGGYFSYDWEKMEGGEAVPKISYVKKFEACNWFLGAGFYIDEIDSTLDAQLAELKKSLIKNLIQIILILIVILSTEFWLINRFNRRYQGDFFLFSNFFRTGKAKYETIDVDKLHFEEFKQMGIVANQMIEQREKFYDQLVKEKKRATESDRLKTAFLANMSHEIRTPMNAILGFSEMINDPNLGHNEKIEYSNIILNNGEHLLGLINDIIDISKIESDQLNITRKKFRLDRLIDTIDLYYRELIASKKGSSVMFLTEVSLPVNFLFNSDEFRVKQVLDNLIGNAIKFTNSGTIKLEVKKINSKIQFKVSDTGIGIPACEQKIIFERFMQAKNSDKETYGGTGLGLAISKNIINLLGGDIELASKPGKGAVFTIYVPE